MLEFREALIDAGAGAVLVQEMRDEIREIYPGLELDGEQMPKAGPAELNPPAGRFLVGYLDGDPVCCGGIKRLDPEACEIKRLYVAPRARGRGVARALLGALEAAARELGYTIARLDTAEKLAGAQELFTSAGYREIPSFNGNPVASFFGEKTL